MIKRAFIDLDGTIIDSSLRHKLVLTDLLNEAGIESSTADYLDYKREGRSTREYLVYMKGVDEVLSCAIAEAWVSRIEMNKYVKTDVLYDDAILFIKFLKAEGYYVDFVTARLNIDGVRESIMALGLDGLFDSIDIVHPANAIQEKTECVQEKHVSSLDIVVGDTEVDYAVCNNTKISGYFLNRGFRSNEFWNRRGVISYYSLEQIKDRLKE